MFTLIISPMMSCARPSTSVRYLVSPALHLSSSPPAIAIPWSCNFHGICMSVRNHLHRSRALFRLGQTASQRFSSFIMGSSLADLPKSGVFTAKLPSDPAFETPESSHQAPREILGPRLVKGALYTFVRPEPTEATELLGVSPKAMKDIGLKPGEECNPEFEAMVSGNKIYWNEEKGGIYPWAQCYGGETRPSCAIRPELIGFANN